MRLLAAALLPILVSGAAGAAETAAWDAGKASVIAHQLVAATDDLYDAFYKQPQPAATPRAVRDWERLKRDIRRMRNVARGLAADLERGEGREETRRSFESLMVAVRWAQERARSVFTTQDVAERARVVGELLGQLAPFYEPGAAAPPS